MRVNNLPIAENNNFNVYQESMPLSATAGINDDLNESKIAVNMLKVSNCPVELSGLHKRMDALSLKDRHKENRIREILNSLTPEELSHVVYLEDLEKFRSVTEPSGLTKALISNTVSLANHFVIFVSGFTWFISSVLKDDESSSTTNTAAGSLAVVSALLTPSIEYFSRYKQTKQKAIEKKIITLAKVLYEQKKTRPDAELPLLTIEKNNIPFSHYNTNYSNNNIYEESYYTGR